eukprot:GHVS01013866.1.p1 GENE.GHVS01013866.1~~GHVS01013866.1.p1  ORF type:complete len:125 (+),score=9.77 GHVS01013866.1:474-848(+)
MQTADRHMENIVHLGRQIRRECRDEECDSGGGVAADIPAVSLDQSQDKTAGECFLLSKRNRSQECLFSWDDPLYGETLDINPVNKYQPSPYCQTVRKVGKKKSRINRSPQLGGSLYASTGLSYI